MLKRIMRVLFILSLTGVMQAVAQLEEGGAASLTPTETLIRNETRFASFLVRMGFADYAKKVLDQLVTAHPEAKPAVAAGRIEATTAQGKFEEAEALIASMPPTSLETMTMRLVIGDRYYQFGKLGKASEMYDTFFKAYPNGPPPEIRMFYEESAYKYSQMLMNKGDNAGAVRALRLVLAAKPEPDIRRRIQADMAELLLKVGAATTGTNQAAAFSEATALCNEVQFKGVDILFGKTVVILAHIAKITGKADQARKIVNDYMPMLQQIDEYLKAEKLPLRDSPMAECRYLLGTFYEEDGRASYGDKTKEAEAAAQLQAALTQYYTVFLKYPQSSWAPAAGQHIDGVVEFLESKGRKVQVPKVDRAPMVAAQLKDAKMLFLDGNFKEAIERYRDVLNVFPEDPASIVAVGELGQCYAQEKDLLFSRTVVRYLVDRFARNEALKKEAGSAVLGIAQAFEESGQAPRAAETYTAFLEAFPGHDRFAPVLFKYGEAKLRTQSYGDALGYFKRLVDECPKARLFPDALSRLAFCQTQVGDFTNAITTLTRYVAELSPGVEKLNASARLADSYRQAQQWVPAINEYARALKSIAQEPALYGGSADDTAKTAKVKERALFWKAFCYSRMREPADKLPDYQAKAIEGYSDFIKESPKSELAPSALSGIGTLYYLQNKPEEAGKAFERLQKEFPNSEQAQNVLFAQGQTLIDLGQTEKAVEVFSRMFGNAKAYNAAQFLKVATIILQAGQYEAAAKAFAQARTSSERGVWESASVGLGQSCSGAGRYADAVVPLEELLAKYKTSGYTVQASLLLSRAYAELAQKETDPKKKTDQFNKAIKAMNTARDFAKEADVLANADIELGNIQLLMGNKNGALASFSRLLMLGNYRDSKVRPYIETAFEKSVPLFVDLGRFSDVMEYCETYLAEFPQGRLTAQARQWRDQMTAKGVQRGGAKKDEDKAPAAAPAAKPQG